jgi:hypothetical protein
VPDFCQPFTLEWDALELDNGLGAILSRNQKSIAYYNKSLAVSSLTKSAHDKEPMALVLNHPT